MRELFGVTDCSTLGYSCQALCNKRSTCKEYSTVIGYIVETLSHEQLGDRLRVNLGLKWVRMNAGDINRFLIHLKADYTALESEDILTIVTENPYEVVEALRVLIRRGTLKGECDICEHLRQ